MNMTLVLWSEVKMYNFMNGETTIESTSFHARTDIHGIIILKLISFYFIHF